MSSETTNDFQKYFEFLKDEDGNLILDEQGNPQLALQEVYRGTGAQGYPASRRSESVTEQELPEWLEIPTAIGETQVISLAPGMFYGNTRVKEIKLLATVATIPEAFCCEAANLEAIDVNGVITTIGKDAFKSTKIKEALFPDLTTLGVSAFSTCTCLEVADIGQVTAIPSNAFNGCTLLREVSAGEVTSIGYAAFHKTRIRQALFPNLTTLEPGAFVNCAYLEVADIGQVTTIPYSAFENCARLRQVIGEKVTTIDLRAFAHTHSLRELPLLAHVSSVADYAFYYSRICTSLPVEGNISQNAFLATKHTLDFWSGVKFTPCQNRITTKLSNWNSEWKDTKLLEEDGVRTYGNSCPLFSVMHIHSAISGKYYAEPAEFVNELKSKGLTACFQETWKGNMTNVEDLFKALGYRTEVRGNGTELSSDDYKALVDALAHGAYIYSQTPIHKSFGVNDGHEDHAVVIYGINDFGEVCVLDSYVLHEPFRAGGFEPDIDIYTYTIPYQNFVDPTSRFVIVHPTEEEPTVEWTSYAADNAFTLDSKLSEYPENRVTICRVTGDGQMPDSEKGILTVYRVGDYAYRTFMPIDNTGMRLYVPSGDTWQDVTIGNKGFTRMDNDSINRQTPPSALPDGVTMCAVTIVDTELPEKKEGYMTAYHLFSDWANAREEWQPIGSEKKYVRYASANNDWSGWYVFTPTVYTPQAGEENSEAQ